MLREPTTLTRESPYQQVWSEPIVHVANRLGLSGRGLGKICARHDIPVPTARLVGEETAWTYRAADTVTAATDPRLNTILLHTVGAETVSMDPPEYLRENDPAWRIEVPADLRLAHPLLKKAQAALRMAARERSQNRGVPWNERYQAKLVKAGSGRLDIAVSKSLVPRALRIMQALVGALERRGYPLFVTPEGTIVHVLDEPFQIELVERFKQVTVTHAYGSNIDLEPSGRLMLRVGGKYSNAGTTDAPPRLIENSLNRVLANMVQRAVELKRQRIVLEEREQRWRIHDDERRRREQARESERLRQRHLRAQATRWARHQRTAHFVAAVEQRLIDGTLDPQDAEVARGRVAWAKPRLKSEIPSRHS